MLTAAEGGGQARAQVCEGEGRTVGEEQGRQEKGSKAELGGFVPREEAVEAAEPATCSPRPHQARDQLGRGWLVSSTCG